jgi:recombination associated protein RdgC
MTTNPYKNFIPYLVSSDAKTDDLDLDLHRSKEPSGGQWRSIGLINALPGEGLLVDLSDAGKLMAVRFNERILPGKVRDEHLGKRVAKLEQMEGRKLSKKEYAQLREEIEFDLLPRAFIRRTVVPVIFTKIGTSDHLMMVCTSSQKRADDVVAVLTAVFGETLKPWKIEMGRPIAGSLTTLACDGFLFNEHTQEECSFYPTDAAVLKGSGKKTIRIKDKDIQEHDVQTLLKQSYAVTELALRYGEDEDVPTLTFTVNDNFVFKRVTLPDVQVTPLKEDAFGFALLCVQTYFRMIKDIVAAFGGMAQRQKPSTETVDEDDEL